MEINKEIEKLSNKELQEHMTDVYSYYEQLCLELHKRKVNELRLFAAEMIMDTNPETLKDYPFV